MRGSLKRNLKIKLDWVKDDQSYNSVKTLNLNAGGLDPSKLRDALGYALFREAGVPAPRTTYAEVTLTVPGKYDKEHLGLYTIIEQVNNAFLKDRFKSDKGLLMKPEGVASVEYYGNEWKFYESLYRPDVEPLVSQSKRVVEFARLVNESSDKQFRSVINSYLDVDTFLRFIAVNALIVNLDTLLAMPQNYYIYLHPKSEKFVFFPWDLDISFAGWPLGGPPEKQMDLSLMHPHSSDEHSLIDRLFAIEAVKARYARIIEELVAGAFSKERMLKNVQRLESKIQEAIERDAAAIASRNERGYPAPLGYRPPGLRAFIAARMVSIKSQLDGDSTGYVFSHARRGGRLGRRGEEGFGRGRLASHMLSQGDSDKDGMLSREELVTLLKGWFDTMDGGKLGKLDKASFVNSLPDAFFPSSDAGSRRPPEKIPESYVSEGLFSAADSDSDGSATKKSLIASFEKWFDSLDKSSRGKLDEKSLMTGLRNFISMTPDQGQ
jgi:spore coat protein H